LLPRLLPARRRRALEPLARLPRPGRPPSVTRGSPRPAVAPRRLPARPRPAPHAVPRLPATARAEGDRLRATRGDRRPRPACGCREPRRGRGGGGGLDSGRARDPRGSAPDARGPALPAASPRRPAAPPASDAGAPRARTLGARGGAAARAVAPYDLLLL